MLRKNPNLTCTEDYLRKILHIPQEGSAGRVVTWIELYTHARLLGMPSPLASPERLTLPRPSLAMQLRAFQKEVRCICKLTTDDAHLFKPSKVKNNLKHLGTIGTHAAIPLRLALGEKLQADMKKQLVQLSRKISSQKCDQFLAGDIQFESVNLMLKHKINWDAAIKGKHIKTATNDARVVDTCAPKRSVDLFHCPV